MTDTARDWIDDIFHDDLHKFRSYLWSMLETAQVSDEEFTYLADKIETGNLSDLMAARQFMDGRTPPPNDPRRQFNEYFKRP